MRNVFTAARLLVLGAIVFVNWIIIGMFLSLFWSGDTPLYAAVLVEGVLIALAFTPAGEAYFRFVNKLRRGLPDEEAALRPIYERVLKRCGIESPPELFVRHTSDVNALAVGTKTVAVTRGALALPADEIEALLAHEIGHLAHGDTKIRLVTHVANLAGTVAAWAITGLIAALGVVGMIGGTWGDRQMFGLGLFLVAFAWLLKLMAWCLSKLLELSFLAVGRSEEYRADAYAAERGYRDALVRLLNRFDTAEEPRGTAALFATHPAVHARIDRLMRV
ncbi:MAG: M48 family metalloprotease [Bacillota bacterium]